MLADWASSPNVRARDIDREYAMGVLRNASVDGQLTSAELDERIREAMRASTLGDLAGLIADLQESPGAEQPPPVDSRRHKGPPLAGIVVAGVALGLGAVALTGYLDTTPTADDYASGNVEGWCYSDPEHIEQCMGDNAIAREGLSSRYQHDLGLPTRLPIPNLAEFEGGNALSATVEDGKTTYRWHLEYQIPSSDQVLVPEIYRMMVDPYDFGALVDDETSKAGVAELSWTEADLPSKQGQLAGRHTLRVRTANTGNGVRVVLDVARSAVGSGSRPDVAGAYAAEVRKVKTATVDGMTYVGSSVTQQKTSPRTCVISQTWHANPAQYTRIEAAAKRLGATVTEVDGGYRVRFDATKNDCELPGV